VVELNQEDIREWVGKSTRLLIKKLSRNDWRWADSADNGHQNGVYIPAEIRSANFFVPIRNVNPKKPHIFEAKFLTFWPATGEIKESKLTHYSNKGPEMHFTRVPKDQFSGLTPASLLIGGALTKAISDCSYWFMIVDSASEEAEMIESMFDLNADFHCGLYNATDIRGVIKNETEQLIDELAASVKAGRLNEFIASVSKLPSPESLASDAQILFLSQNRLEKLNPYEIENPGDALMQISRDIEYKIYKRAELRHRAAEVIRIVTAGGPDIVTSIVHGFAELDATFLSASQHRKSRAGRSFEQHIARLLSDGNIQYEEQAVTGGRRPDFVLPNLAVLKSKKRTFEGALVLSAKTTLRERWKQVAMEKFNCGLFLATVDDRVSFAAIEDMTAQGICLVVPESLKESKETCYEKSPNVITFRQFFDEEISLKRPRLKNTH
jgi:hypothetical protein